MKKFNFKLDTVLGIREGIEQEWESKLGKANSECQLIKNKIDSYKALISDSKDTVTDINQFQIKCIYEDRLNSQIVKEKVLLKDKEAKRDEIKKIYLQKSIDRKIIDKLKDKSLKSFKKESLRQESITIDEINNSSKIREEMLGGVN
ncbi:MAG: hypothetical protein B6229_02480 [Spirochaetaceae bacterium 4572_7]|nr:MAG: hypothetical protein B6229_02480 [Spirochaetaceae bacterium 4572_7]